jgi:ribosomal protein S18 acetylase RimI-like enzyme
MQFSNDIGRISKLLRAAPLQNVVTLKMLRVIGTSMQFQLLEKSGGWALMSLFSAEAFEYDRQTYADRELVVLIDGTSAAAKVELLGHLPNARLVVKTSDEVVGAHLRAVRSARAARSFLSFTSPENGAPQPRAPGLSEGTHLTPEVARMFAQNGYMDSELGRHFADGARWFAVHRNGRTCSAGFVFRNFESVWEIGGIYTEPEYRRQGFGRAIVAAALSELLGTGRIPRYQVRSDNEASIHLARASGLVEFLRIDHLLVDPEERPRAEG